MGVRIVLTGAAGFIGKATWRKLVTAGHDVVAVDLLIPAAHGPTTREAPPAEVHVLDTRSAQAWSHLIDGADVVIHLAAMVGAGATAADLPRYAGHNDLGTAAMLAAMHHR
ncbi:MAG: NAD-dependent epimerase/dehydratase family protein, partial [Phycicoccus sp.]